MRLHIISHTHWDREWFVPSEFTREWLPPFFDALLERFAAEESYRFVLDGQSILLEDYLLQLEETEQERAARRISELATSRRLVLGPYYQQPDWQLAGEESLLRNLLIGTGDAAAFGEVSRCGWLMDNFGQIAQAVQIHNGFGIAAVFAWRGFDLLPDRLRDLIIWESPDGSRLPVVYLIDSYRNGMRLFSHETFLERRLLACLDRLAPFSEDGELLAMNGYDQEMEPENVPAALRRIEAPVETLVSDPHSYLETKAACAPPAVSGAQRSGRFISVFPGVLSARQNLKRANHFAEVTMSRYVDPLVALCCCYRQGDGEVRRELSDEVDLLWRLILQNHPHDSICGVSADVVHEEMEIRFSQIETRQRRLIERIPALLGDGRRGALLLFNPSIWPRRTLVETAEGGLAPTEEIPPLSVAPAVIEAPRQEVTVRQEAAAYLLENRHIQVRVTRDGWLTLRDLKSGVVIKESLRLFDTGDRGDSYSEDRLNDGEAVDPQLREVEILEARGSRVVLRAQGTLLLPEALDTGRRRRLSRRVENPICLLLELRQGERFLRLGLSLFNKSRDHRLQMRFEPPGGEGKVLSRVHFAWEEPAESTPRKKGALPPEVERLMLGAREPEGSDTFPTLYAVASGGEQGATLVVHRGLYEGELLGEGVFGLTLLRSVGWLARPDLDSRTGDAGPQIRTPWAQMPGRIDVEIAIAPMESLAEAVEGSGNVIVEEFLHPLLSLSGGGDDDASPSGPLVSLPALANQEERSPFDGLSLSTVKLPESGTGGSIILRLVNLSRSERPLPACLRDSTPLTLSERPGGSASLGPAEIQTLALEVEGEAVSGEGQSWRYRFRNALAGRFPSCRFSGRRHLRSQQRWTWLFGAGGAGASADAPLPDRSGWREYLEEGVREEGRRLEYLEGEEKRLYQAATEAEREDPELLRIETVRRRSEFSTIHRERLEAELSLLYAEWELNRFDREQSAEELERICDRIRTVALALNHARVAKRSDDYLLALSREDPSERAR